MRKLMWFSVGFGIAAFVGLYFLWKAWYFLAAGIVAVLLAAVLALMMRLPKLRIFAVMLFGCIVGFCWMFLFDSIYLSVPRAADAQPIEMTVTTMDFPEETQSGCVVESLGYLNGKPYKIRVHLQNRMALQPGDQLTCRFFLSCSLPGCSRESEYYCSNGSFLSAVAKRAPDVMKAEKAPWHTYPAYVRQFVRERIHESLPDREAGFAVALLIGDSDGIDYETDVAFIRSGIRHIIAVSGLHVTILFSFVYILFGKRRIPAVLIGIPVMCFFAAVAGFSPSITRACIMHTLMALALLFGKEYDPPTALGFAVLVILVVNPWSFIHVGFQLSVACMIGIFIIAPAVQNWFMDEKRFGKWKGKKRRLATFVVSSVSVSLGAVIFSAPLCAYYFGVVSLVSVLSNLLTLWMITYIFYGILALCLVGLLWNQLAVLVGYLLMIPIRYVLWISKTISSFPLAAIYMDSIYMVAWLVFAYVLLGAFLLMKKKQPLILICCACISLCVALTASWTEPLTNECSLTVLDVGQGQCVILQSEGRTFLVDCGGDLEEDAASTAVNRLRSQGIDTLDGIILTHFDRDHAGGVPYLLTQLSCAMLYLPNCADADGTLDAIVDGEIPVQTIENITEITFADTCITLIPSKQKLSDNESGLCVLFQRENCDILITGDRSSAGEMDLLRTIELPELDVLVVGHHGSKSSTSEALLTKTSPEIAIISVGADNFYGHPSQDTLQRLEDAGCRIYRTDLHGTITFRGG